MVEYCEGVIQRIKEEEDLKKVRGIVLDSIEEFGKHSQNTSRYVVNMIVILQSSGVGTTFKQANISHALGVFKEYYRQDYRILF